MVIFNSYVKLPEGNSKIGLNMTIIDKSTKNPRRKEQRDWNLSQSSLVFIHTQARVSLIALAVCYPVNQRLDPYGP